MRWTADELGDLQSEHDAEGAAELAEELREIGLTAYTAGRLPLHPQIAVAAAESADPAVRWSALAQPSVNGSRSAINKAKKEKKASMPKGAPSLAVGESAIRREFADDGASPFERIDYLRNQLTPVDLFTVDNLQIVWDKTGRFAKGKSIDWKATRQMDEFVLLSPDMPESTRKAVTARGEEDTFGRPTEWEARSLATPAERLVDLATTTTSRAQLYRVAGNLVTPPDVLIQIYDLDDGFLDSALAANTSLPTSIAESMISHESVAVRQRLSCNIACPRHVLVELCRTFDDKHLPRARHHLELLDGNPEVGTDGMWLATSASIARHEAHARSLIPRRKREATWSFQSDSRLKRLVVHNVASVRDDAIDRSKQRDVGSAI